MESFKKLTLSLPLFPTGLERVCIAIVKDLLVICLNKKSSKMAKKKNLLAVGVGKPTILTVVPKKGIGRIKCDSPAPLFESPTFLPLWN